MRRQPEKSQTPRAGHRAGDLGIAKRLVKTCIRGFRRGLGNFRDQPFNFAGLDFILCDATGLARTGIDHRWSSTLQLPRPPCRYQDIAIVAVKTFDELHELSPGTSTPCWNESRIGL